MKSFLKRCLTLTLVTFLTACTSFAFTATKKSTFYEYEGKTYEVQEYYGNNVANFTLYEIVDGDRKFAGYYEDDKKLPTDEQEAKQHIETIIADGKQVGDPEIERQRSIDFTIRDDE